MSLYTLPPGNFNQQNEFRFLTDAQPRNKNGDYIEIIKTLKSFPVEIQKETKCILVFLRLAHNFLHNFRYRLCV